MDQADYSLKRKFDTARKENKIQPEWNNFDDLPSRIRGTVPGHPIQVAADDVGDFKMNYPWYFQYKELSSPSGSFERPPIRPRAIRLEPVRDSTTPAPAPPTARSRQRLPPSPSPSDRSSSASSWSSSPSLSPSPSPSPSPVPSPSPPHVASLLHVSPTPRPNLDVQRSLSASVALSGPRPHIRQNAVASSSPIPIKVESSPSSSSASPASDIHLWGGPDSIRQSDMESEHEMENDTVDVSSRRISSPSKFEDTLDEEAVITAQPQILRGTAPKRARALSSLESLQEGPSKRQRSHPTSSRSITQSAESQYASKISAEANTGGTGRQGSRNDREVEDDIDDPESASSVTAQRDEALTQIPSPAASSSCPRCVIGPRAGGLGGHTCKFSQQCRRRLSLAARYAMLSPHSIDALSQELPHTSSQKLLKARSPRTRAVVLCRERSHLLCKTVRDMCKRK
jgi:hypothetical protein